MIDRLSTIDNEALVSEIYFAQIREDSRIERHLQTTYGPRRILCIGSGGCTAFSLLADDVDSVVVVDANPAQCALIELKRAALIALDREEYLAFIGELPSANRLATYRRIEDDLTDQARRYWRGHQPRVASGINRCGVTDRLYQMVGENLTGVLLGKEAVDLLFSCTDVDEQREFYTKYLDNERWDTAVRVLFSRTTQSYFYPPLWSAKSTEAKFGDFYAAQIKDAIVNRPVADNYFLHQLLTGRYLHDRADGMPAYLTEDGYERARRNIGTMQLVNATVERSLRDVRGIEAFFLSNILDWGGPQQHAALAQAIRDAASPDGAVVLHRSMYGEGQLGPIFGEHIRMRPEIADELLEQERSMLYQELCVGELV